MNPLREDKPLNIGSLSIVFLLLISSVVSVNFSFAQTTGEFPQSIIASSSTNTTPHLLKLKATQQDGTETRVSGFSIDTTSAIAAQANSQLLILVTDSSLRVTEAKVRTASNQVINLVPATSQQAATAFSLANLPGGVYTLDVITQKGSAKAAYEGVLSIGNQPATVIEETTRRVTNEYGDLILIFLPISCDVENPPPECGEPIICDEGFTLTDDGICVPICPMESGGDQPDGCKELPPIDPCDVDNPPPECEEEIPPIDPCDVPNPPEECIDEPENPGGDGTDGGEEEFPEFPGGEGEEEESSGSDEEESETDEESSGETTEGEEE